MHRYFRKFKYPERNEWFYYSDEIVKNFDSLEIPDDSSFDSLYSLPRFEERLKYFSLYAIDHPEDLNKIPEDYLLYITKFKYEEMSSCGFRKDVLDKKSRLRKSFKEIESDLRVRRDVLSEFVIGNSYKKKDIKRMLMKISGSYGYKTKLRAIDLGKFFNIKGVLIPNKGTSKRDAGFKILSIKE